MKIFFIDTVHPVLWQLLSADGHQCVEAHQHSRGELLKLIPEADAIVIRSRLRLDKELLDAASSLKVIARAGAGLENIDVDYAKSKKISVLNSPEGNRDAVGEHAVTMLLALFNRINIADKEVRNGQWIREGNRGYELQGRTVGLIGYGNIGSAFAKKLRGFDCNVIAYDKYRMNFNGENGVKECTMDEIFSESEILSLHIPLTSETEYLVNEEFIQNFTKPFYLINTARGKCVKTEALTEGLKSKKILGACLDVLEYEDSSFEKFNIEKAGLLENPVWQYLINSDRVILSPHIAGWTFESNEKMAKVLYDKMKEILKN
jgi:D-3-phosphoglycerate dehydrogenase / 2-oxoglutarate reductase